MKERRKKKERKKKEKTKKRFFCFSRREQVADQHQQNIGETPEEKATRRVFMGSLEVCPDEEIRTREQV